jgi:hypothetical protein
MQDAPQQQEHFGWRTFRPPPPPAIVFGIIYGAVVGAFIAWDVAVLIRLFRLTRRRVSEELERRHGNDEPDRFPDAEG